MEQIGRTKRYLERIRELYAGTQLVWSDRRRYGIYLGDVDAETKKAVSKDTAFLCASREIRALLTYLPSTQSH